MRLPHGFGVRTLGLQIFLQGFKVDITQSARDEYAQKVTAALGYVVLLPKQLEDRLGAQPQNSHRDVEQP